MLRDVREGIEAPPRATQAPEPKLSAPSAPPAQKESHELISMVIGKAFVIIPVAAILVFGLWTGYEQGVGSGMSVTAAVLMSIASLALTVGGAFVWVAIRRRKG